MYGIIKGRDAKIFPFIIFLKCTCFKIPLDQIILLYFKLVSFKCIVVIAKKMTIYVYGLQYGLIYECLAEILIKLIYVYILLEYFS